VDGVLAERRSTEAGDRWRKDATGPMRVVDVWQVAERSPSGGGSGGGGTGGGGGSEADKDLLSDRDLRTIEREFQDGLSSVQIVDIFTHRGIRFSEATFRKYVQVGLLQRSRRVGRKGKHQGSMGLYPASTVRRINLIKRLMGQGYTIEEIQAQFLRYADEIDGVGRALSAIFGWFEEDFRDREFDAQAKKALRREIDEARKTGEELVRVIESIERRLAKPKDRPPGARTPEGFEDLL
jgi:DNA-binding transcriptional MerR regulator